MPYDDHGHGSHVAGIILGNGYDSHGRQAGMAPDASLVSLKVLDADGKGTISRIIAALDWVAANAGTYNIRVVNLSVGAAVTQSYWIDPLALAARQLTEKGIVVVAAAGNLGQDANGELQYGGILAPGNAPWVLTVGASSTEGTLRDQDDVVAGFSSLGPTRGDYLAKPDLVAPGRGILSLAVPGSTLYQNNADYLVSGNVSTGSPAYLSLSGTSMAAPQVSGAAALMLQANPALTPNLVKAILQYTAHVDSDYGPLQEGAGFLDVLGAVRLSSFYAQNRPGSHMPVENTWSQQFIWGNQLVSGGYINPLANAWANNIVWGTAAATPENIVWGTAGSAENIVWGTLCGNENCSNIVWGTADANGANIVWGTANNIVWGTTTADNIVWGTAGPENIVWGTSGGASENIVWGTACGSDNCANIVWGTTAADNIVWGTVGPYEKSSGARRRTSSGEPGARAATSSGAQQPRPATSCGARRRTATSCGAPRTTRTSSGEQPAPRTSCGGPQRTSSGGRPTTPTSCGARWLRTTSSGAPARLAGRSGGSDDREDHRAGCTPDCRSRAS